jgi:succinate dehydrogenase/fumarate reductase cytochrome b subunit
MKGSKKKIAEKVQLGQKVHRITGYILTLLIVGHIGATRFLPLLALEDPSAYDYSFSTQAFNKVGNVFVFYLVIFGGAGIWHLMYGTWSALGILSGRSVIGKSVPLPLVGLALVSLVALLLGVLAVTGFFYQIEALVTKGELHEKLDEKIESSIESTILACFKKILGSH